MKDVFTGNTCNWNISSQNIAAGREVVYSFENILLIFYDESFQVVQRRYFRKFFK